MATELLATDELLKSFLTDLDALNKDVSFFVCDGTTYERGTELTLLLDPLTGLPYPLAPVEETLPTNNPEVANWHHGVHPRDNPLLKTMGGRAMRSSQIQLVTKEQHNHGPDARHRLDVSPFLHRDIGHQVGMCIMAAAGAAHRLAIHTEDKKMWLKPMTPQQLKQLQIEGELVEVSPRDVEIYRDKKKPHLTLEQAEEALIDHRRRQAILERRNIRYGYDPLRAFFKEQVLTQDLGNVKSKVIHRFMTTGSEEKGLELLGVAAQELVKSTTAYNGESIETLYRKLFQAGKLGQWMPCSADELVNHKLGDVDGRRLLVPELYNQLRERKAA